MRLRIGLRSADSIESGNVPCGANDAMSHAETVWKIVIRHMVMRHGPLSGNRDCRGTGCPQVTVLWHIVSNGDGLQVSYNAMVPALLFTSLGSTLARQPEASLLAIPLVAALQVLSSFLSLLIIKIAVKLFKSLVQFLLGEVRVRKGMRTIVVSFFILSGPTARGLGCVALHLCG